MRRLLLVTVLIGFFGAGTAAAAEWKVSVVSDNPDVVDINALELTDTRHVPGVIYENAIGFNDFRGTANQIALSPGLGEANLISRNFGENRGHGLHPGVFQPAR